MEVHAITILFITIVFTILCSTNGINTELSRSAFSQHRRNAPSTILDDRKCDELKNYCNNFSENDDLLILECLQSVNPDLLSKVKEDCQNVIWSHMSNLLSDSYVNKTLLAVCKSSEITCPNDNDKSLLKCVVNRKDRISNIECTTMVNRLENVAFQDYRWIGNFLEHCSEEVIKLKCGLINAHTFSQLETIVCLQNKIALISDECKKEVIKLSELQADSIKFDQQLFLECAEDHTRYCQQFLPGSGRVFTCLMDQSPERLSSGCKKNLLRRQKLIAQDYHVSKGLMRACREDIKKAQCRRRTSGDKATRLAQVLLCLENVAKNGTKIDTQCQVEMVEHRKLLLSDYSLSPEIMDGCREEIKMCSGLESGGKTLHCLMELAQLKKGKKIGDVCQRALEALIEQTDAGENWSVDPVLHQSCYSVVKSVCHGLKGGDARVMSCLMDNIGADHMTEECEDALIQIQYFVGRDFKLDPQLYRACKKDAEKLCHASNNWNDPNHADASYGPQVLPCLYRNAYHSDSNEVQLDKSCLQQIRRVMRQRAVSVDLHPEIEEACLNDLADYCTDKTKKGEEILCLQNNFEDLDGKCQDAIETFTEAEGEHADLNPYIMAHCRKEMETLCIAELKNDEGDIMDCLVSHKNDPVIKANLACRSSIEHFQIISLKNYRFTYKFKLACKNHAMRYCVHAKTKNEVVACLSEKITNDTIDGRRSDVSKECRQQIKSQLFQQRENIDFDPKLKAACSPDIKKYCAKIPHGNAQVLECLQNVHEKLTDKCEQELFKVKEQEMNDNSIDYALMKICSDSIEQFCPHHDKSTVLDCLKYNKDEKGFSTKCRLVVMHRMIEQNSNYMLNPSLQKNCKPDIQKFCFNIIQTNGGHDINNRVIKCLKANFKIAKLSSKCEKEMVSILREQALNINLNPLLRAVCKYELEYVCKMDDEDTGTVEECLKNALLMKKITSPQCQNEVASMIEESEADIHVDPVLQQACALDLLKFCADVPQGNGRHIKCLKILVEGHPTDLNPECRNMLRKRLEMYKNAAQVAPPQDFQELYHQVVLSPAKHYLFFMVTMVFGTVFVVGLFCGRTTRRHMLIKNK